MYVFSGCVVNVVSILQLNIGLVPIFVLFLVIHAPVS